MPPKRTTRAASKAAHEDQGPADKEAKERSRETKRNREEGNGREQRAQRAGAQNQASHRRRAATTTEADIADHRGSSKRERDQPASETTRQRQLGGRRSGRLKSAKALPEFSGNILEWFYFKKTFELTSELRDYSPQENVTRLVAALKGKARETVSMLLATTRDASEAMRTLELHVGDKRTIATKIVHELKELPALGSGKIKLTHFASKLKNAVSALKSLKLKGHLHNPNLIDCIAKKLPFALKYGYNSYAESVVEDEAKLETLSNFLFHEAEKAVAGGIFDLEEVAFEDTAEAPRKTAPRRVGKAFAVVTEYNDEAGSSGTSYTRAASGKTRSCEICNRDNNGVAKCKAFVREGVGRRRFLAQKNGLCYRCLGSGHVGAKCRSRNCTIYRGGHHILLHRCCDH
ncbi:uncharacterized protein LOC128896475 [Hylaeus anthracinus]|uniref:uncharacterized protein LOC128896475 n=1 Tax=Hylaeus anthracinus TaxID=313031 RepID=UPI0023B8FA30|nr:uncharacterized protein LOC128896475 [Hylaeus anthracinus]